MTELKKVHPGDACCVNCRRFLPDGGSVESGICRAHPPVIVMVPHPVNGVLVPESRWPQVTREDGCGEFVSYSH